VTLSDPLYFAFLAGVFLLFYLVRAGMAQLLVLLAASYYFYFRLSGYSATILVFNSCWTPGRPR
jgi:hypothetical protein